jgi:hypothetical protein
MSYNTPYNMGQEIVYCGRCQTRVTGADFEKGIAVRISNSVCCLACLTPLEKRELEQIRDTPTRRTNPPQPGTTRRSSPAKPEPGQRSPVLVLTVVAGGVLLLVGCILVFALNGHGEGAPPRQVESPAATTPRVNPPATAVDPKADLPALNAELAGPLSQNNFRLAQVILDRERGRARDPQWAQAIAGLDRDLGDRARRRLKELMETARKAADLKALDDIREARGEIARWGAAFDTLLREFDEAFSAILATSAPVPDPPAPVVPAPPTPKPRDPAPAAPALAADPDRSDAGRRYLEPWEKAMFFATRRDYARAAADLRVAARGFKEEDVLKESAADLQDLERLKALHPEFLKVLAEIPSWEEVVLEVIREDGRRETVRGHVLQARARRLELRGDPPFVEHEDLAPATLVKLFTRKRGKPSPEDARSLALLCALDGDATAAREVLGDALTALSPKLWNYAASVRGKLAKPDAAVEKNERSARTLFHEAEAEFRSIESRGAAVEKFGRLLGACADTEFVKRNRPDILARLDETRDCVLTGVRLAGRGIFSVQKLPVAIRKEKVDMVGWKSREDLSNDDPNSHVEARFYALPGVEYKGWALVGGCCATTFTWYLQASELSSFDRKSRKAQPCEPGSNFAAPWDHHLRSLSTTHGGKDHAKAEKEPTQWEWAELPIPKYATGGPKSIRFIGSSKGMAVAAVVISSIRDKRPSDEETRKLAQSTIEEGVPTHALRAGKGEPDLLAQIPEAKPYVLVYDLDLARLCRPVKYDVENHGAVTRPFDRVAYLVELQPAGGAVQYVFVSMDAFTDDAGKVGIPDVATGARFQQKVTSMNVHSNVEGIVTGIQLDGGNIEFWPNNYGPGNAAAVPGASNDVYDFGDQITEPVAGHGSMQVHNHKAGQTIFAINRWSAGAGAELGIGNSTGKTRDWTFTANAGSYSFKRLRVLVRPKA